MKLSRRHVVSNFNQSHRLSARRAQGAARACTGYPTRTRSGRTTPAAPLAALPARARTLLVEGNERLGDGLAHGVHLGDVATTAHADADVQVGEALAAEEQHGLEGLEAEGLRLQQLDGRAVDADEAAAALAVGDSDRVLLLGAACGRAVTAGPRSAPRPRARQRARRTLRPKT